MVHRGLAVTTLVGMAAAGAVLAFAPVASADPDQQQCPQQQAPPGEPQQSCAQPAMPGTPNLPKGDGPQKPANPSNVDVSDKACVMIDGIPTIIPPAGLVMEGQHDTGLPCFYVFGVNPH